MVGALALAAFVLLLSLLCFRITIRRRRSAPGPASLPLVGHLHLLLKGSGGPHVVLMELARSYGPVMSLRFGSVPVVVASTKHAAREFLKAHDLTFASRPPSAVGRLLFNGYQDMVFAPYDERWRQLRRLCTVELLTSRRVDSYKSLRKQELRSLLHCLYLSQGEAVDMRKRLKSTIFNLMCRILIGKAYYDQAVQEDDAQAAEFMHLIDEVIQLIGAFSIGEYMPYLRWMDLDKIETRFKAVARGLHSVMETILVEHEAGKKPSSDGESVAAEDFVDMLLKLRDQGEECLQQRDGIKSLLINLFGAGSETSAVTLEWGLAELIKHPEPMARLQDEIANAVGTDRLVEETDVPKLKYLDAVVKETLRLHPPAVLIQHYSMQDSTVMGYHIPKGTTLLINAYVIARDPDVWEDPLAFRPERFLGSSIDYKGHDYGLIPFGSGRRICPGITMSMSMVYFALANLVHAFDWKIPPGQSLDTDSEDYGLTVSMASRLQAIARARLPKAELYC